MNLRERLLLAQAAAASHRESAAMAHAMAGIFELLLMEWEHDSGELEARLAAEQTAQNWEQWFLDDTQDAASSRGQ